MEKSKDKKKFDKIVRNIKEIKIQGARNIAKTALEAYILMPTKISKRILLNSRPTEPMMKKVLDLAESEKSYKEILRHFDEAQKKINFSALRLIKNKDRIFTHCHSTNVVKALIYAKKQGKNFEVYVSETRPLFQGIKTSKELKKAGIKVTMFIDSASAFALEKEKSGDKIYSNKIFLGADALLREGIINKIGSKIVSEIAYLNHLPVYILADSWKFTKEKILIEQRKLNEIWNKAPKTIKIKNPAFEFVPKKYISGIVTEFGLMTYDKFVRLAEKNKLY